MPPIQTTLNAVHKNFEVKLLDKRDNGGRIIISTGHPDRQRDRVIPTGARLENYQRNPIVQWGHNYKDPFATIGRTTALTVSPDGLIADFELRPAANDADPQNVVLLLWNGEWIKTASIGFVPLAGKGNELGGNDFTEWELLEWSLVPVPANAEALRLAMKSLDEAPHVKDAEILPGEPTPEPLPDPDATQPAPAMRAWIRKVTVETDATHQHYACFMLRSVAVPEDAVILIQDDELNDCREEPHPDRGTVVTLKTVLFVPPLNLADGRKVYTIEKRDMPDEELMQHAQWKIVETSDLLDSLPAEDALKGLVLFDFNSALPVDVITDRTFERAAKLLHRLRRRSSTPSIDDIQRAIDTLLEPPDISQQKAGRVLSRKNENKIKAARDTLDEVLSEVAEQPEQDSLNDMPVVMLDCPFCGEGMIVFSWGMYSCRTCGGTFEVMPEDEDIRAHHFPDMAEVLAVDFGTIVKGAIPPHTTPKADPGMAWDAGAVLRAAPNDRAVLRRIHAWVNSDSDPDAKGSYKLPHHLVDGKVVLRGVNNAKARLPQSNIPQADRGGVEIHLNRHQAQFEKAQVLRDYARALQEAADELDGEQHLSDEDERALVGELRTLLDTVKEAIQ